MARDWLLTLQAERGHVWFSAETTTQNLYTLWLYTHLIYICDQNKASIITASTSRDSHHKPVLRFSHNPEYIVVTVRSCT